MNSIKTVGLGIIYMALISCIILFSVTRKKENIIQKSQIAFYTAIGKEKKLFIQKVFINFDSKYSPDTIPASDKIEWANQLYLTMEDSCRHRLDSLFNEEMARQGLNLQTAITYTYNGKSTSSRTKDFLKKATLIQTNRYTKENKKETDLIVRAYAYLPFYLLLDNITVYLLALLNVMGLTVFFYMKRHTKKQAQTMRLSPLETEKRKTDPSKWCSIHEGFLWNEREHSIKHNEKTIILNGESLKFFKLFLKKEAFFLNYSEIYTLYGLIDESPEIKDRIYHSIRQLKKDLSDFNITIQSVRGKGYKLIFPTFDEGTALPE